MKPPALGLNSTLVINGQSEIMIYLASPYSHPDPAVREQRFRAAGDTAAALIRAGHIGLLPDRSLASIGPAWLAE